VQLLAVFAFAHRHVESRARLDASMPKRRTAAVVEAPEALQQKGAAQEAGSLSPPHDAARPAGRSTFKPSRLCKELEINTNPEPWAALKAGSPDWWQPQPTASLDHAHVQTRPSRPLAIALSCRVCGDLLKEATMCSECGHTYCHDCISDCILIGGDHNVCPVDGCHCVLGPLPFEHHKLMYDSCLDGIVSKVFPRPELDAALKARREQREPHRNSC